MFEDPNRASTPGSSGSARLTGTSCTRIWVPQGPSRHDTPSAGHGGCKRTVEKSTLSRLCYWPGLRQQVSQFVASCVKCEQAKPLTAPPTASDRRDSMVISCHGHADRPVTASGYDSVMVYTFTLSKTSTYSSPACIACMGCRCLPSAIEMLNTWPSSTRPHEGLQDRPATHRGAQAGG
jgi:hypothetical protein